MKENDGSVKVHEDLVNSLKRDLEMAKNDLLKAQDGLKKNTERISNLEEDLNKSQTYLNFRTLLFYVNDDFPGPAPKTNLHALSILAKILIYGRKSRTINEMTKVGLNNVQICLGGPVRNRKHKTVGTARVHLLIF